MLRFQTLSGDTNLQEYGGKLVSKKVNHGDFDFWIVIEILNWIEAVGEREAPATYHVEVSIVAPSQISPTDLQSALDCYGIDESNLSELTLVEIIHSYGIKAILWQGDSNNFHKLMKEARKEAWWRGDGILFGFTMDAPQNAIGTTGWDMIRGDLLSPLKR